MLSPLALGIIPAARLAAGIFVEHRDTESLFLAMELRPKML